MAFPQSVQAASPIWTAIQTELRQLAERAVQMSLQAPHESALRFIDDVILATRLAVVRVWPDVGSQVLKEWEWHYGLPPVPVTVIGGRAIDEEEAE